MFVCAQHLLNSKSLLALSGIFLRWSLGSQERKLGHRQVSSPWVRGLNVLVSPGNISWGIICSGSCVTCDPISLCNVPWSFGKVIAGFLCIHLWSGHAAFHLICLINLLLPGNMLKCSEFIRKEDFFFFLFSFCTSFCGLGENQVHPLKHVYLTVIL